MIPLLGISQNGYPKMLLINNDTVVGFSKEQSYILEEHRVKSNYLEQYNSLLKERMDIYKEVITNKDKIIFGLEKNVKDHELIMSINEATIAVQKNEIRKQKRKAFMIGGIGIAGIAGIFAIMK